MTSGSDTAVAECSDCSALWVGLPAFAAALSHASEKSHNTRVWEAI